MRMHSDRHKFVRKYCSGASKRKAAREKSIRQEAEQKKNKCITSIFSSQKRDLLILPPLNDLSIDDIANPADSVGVIGVAPFDGFGYDIGLWPGKATNMMIDYWAIRSSEEILKLQNYEGEFDKSEIQLTSGLKNEIRRCTMAIFSRRAQNDEVILRSWLCYSPAVGRVYCYICKLMAGDEQQLSGEGYCDWGHAGERLAKHELSLRHTANTISLVQRGNVLDRIDVEQQKHLEDKCNYWRNILKRCVSVTRLIAERGLAFRGADEIVGSSTNGNFLGILELIAEYDKFLAEHVSLHANKGSGHTNYLSSTVYEELIEIMGKATLKVIVDCVKRSKYYSVSVDSTPDIAHVDQLTVILRYIEVDEPVERFITFLDKRGHTGQRMADSLLNVLAENGINFDDCRGQSYDKAANMSGKYNGMQAILREKNSLAVFIPCSSHSLNLVGQAAVDSCRSAVAFFDFVQELYTFFTASTSRYELLNTKLAEKKLPVPKRLINIRWSAHANAVKAVFKGYRVIMEVLNEIAEDRNEKGNVCNTATGLHKQMCRLETGIFTECWNVILERLNATNIQLQNPKMDLNTSVHLLKSLKVFIESLRSEFDRFEEGGNCLTGIFHYHEEVGRKRRKNVRLTPLGDTIIDEDAVIGKDKFRLDSFFPLIDMLLSALQTRVSAYSEVSQKFGFLSKLESLNEKEIRRHSLNLVGAYADDLEDSLAEELIQFRSLLISSVELFDNDQACSNELNMYKAIINKRLKSTFPNVEIMLRIYLSLMISNATGERSFSKLKLIKNNLRSTMGQNRLVSLSLMSIECDIMRSIDFSDIINEFARRKARRVHL